MLLIGSSGYIGSYLVEILLEQTEIELTTVDSRPGGDIQANHQTLSQEFLNAFEIVLFFAGSSSVQQSVGDPWSAAEENCWSLVKLAKKLRSGSVLIYASSASVYGAVHTELEASGDSIQDKSFESSSLSLPLNIYDGSKIAADTLLLHLPVKTVGLRMGTVSGWSRNFRPELVFNSFVNATVRSKNPVLKVTNPRADRTLLFLSDLAIVILKLIEKRENELPRILNVGSLSMKIGEIANGISRITNAAIEIGDGNPTYSFRLDLTMQSRLGAAPVHTFEEQAKSLIDSLERGKEPWVFA